jgi:hypothetical protein
MSPRRSATAAASCRDENGGTGRRSSTAPVRSSGVGRDAEHDLPDVALLVLGEEGSDLGSCRMHTGKSPVANGSSVPRCPTFVA